MYTELDIGHPLEVFCLPFPINQSESGNQKSPFSANTRLLIGCGEKIKLHGILEANCAGENMNSPGLQNVSQK